MAYRFPFCSLDKPLEPWSTIKMYGGPIYTRFQRRWIARQAAHNVWIFNKSAAENFVARSAMWIIGRPPINMLSTCTRTLNLLPYSPTVSLKRLGFDAASFQSLQSSLIGAIDDRFVPSHASPFALLSLFFEFFTLAFPNTLCSFFKYFQVYRTNSTSSTPLRYTRK